MKNSRNFAFLSAALILLPAIASQTSAELFDMAKTNYPKSESLEFNNLICEVKNVYQFEEDSSLVRFSNEASLGHKILELIGLYKSGIYGKFIGQKFIINRDTGKYKFKDFDNDYYINTLIDLGSKEQSYKVISTSSGKYIHTQYIQVDVYQKNGEMNFKIMNDDILFTGYCQLG